MKEIKIYKKPFGYIGSYDWEDEKTHKEMIAGGWKVDMVEEYKDWDGATACCLAVVFLPLALFGRVTYVRVFYVR